jgi:hypothetical protein
LKNRNPYRFFLIAVSAFAKLYLAKGKKTMTKEGTEERRRKGTFEAIYFFA